MTMLERMGDAIERQMAEDENDGPSLARAALLAIREPSYAMMAEWQDDAIMDCWRGMIDAILSGDA